ncbi:hypothetical protein EYZ11_000129 [Aspergillus tanneri]|uniref:Uncharacterized protein n=1 Tax=Aspergillus tanneri TaxID=1220188 RepID=A0A4S3JXW7_9EURO|nr:hypothetical protein EYZ11_000129 [Aspergillus tanneri]
MHARILTVILDIQAARYQPAEIPL